MKIYHWMLSKYQRLRPILLNILFTLLFTFTLCSFSSTLLAAPFPNISQAIQTLRSTAEPGRTGETLSEEGQREGVPFGTDTGLQPPPSSELAPEVASIKFTLNRIHILDPVVFNEAELLSPFQHLIGGPLTVGELKKIAESITTKYQKAGFILTQVIIPRQEIQGGVVKLQVISGFIDKVEVKGKVCPELQAMLMRYAEKIAACRPLQVDTLERYTLLANDIPGLIVNAVLKPSKTTPKATDLILVAEEKLENAYANVNNLGTRFLGPRQYMFGLEEDSWLRAGDASQIQAVTTANAELNFTQFRHTLPMGYEGLKFGLLTRFVRSEPGSILLPLDAKGKNKTGGLDLSYPIIRTRKHSLLVIGGFMVTDSKADLVGAPLYADRIRPIFGTLVYSRLDSMKGFNKAELTLTQGLKILKASGETNISRPGGQSAFTKLNAGLSRQQSLPRHFSILALVQGQYSFQPLLSISQFGFGGSELGRGYDPSEILGDKGIAGTLELHYEGISSSKIVPTADYYIFYDWGKVWHTDPTIKQASATSTGIGARFNITKYGKASFYIAKPLTRNVMATQNRNIRAFFSLTVAI